MRTINISIFNKATPLKLSKPRNEQRKSRRTRIKTRPRRIKLPPTVRRVETRCQSSNTNNLRSRLLNSPTRSLTVRERLTLAWPVMDWLIHRQYIITRIELVRIRSRKKYRRRCRNSPTISVFTRRLVNRLPRCTSYSSFPRHDRGLMG